MPYADPEDRRRFEMERARRRRSLGLCANCTAKAMPGHVRCQTCFNRWRLVQRRDYSGGEKE